MDQFSSERNYTPSYEHPPKLPVEHNGVRTPPLAVRQALFAEEDVDPVQARVSKPPITEQLRGDGHLEVLTEKKPVRPFCEP